MIDLENLKKNLKEKMPPKALKIFLENYLRYKVGTVPLALWESSCYASLVIEPPP